MFHQSPPLHLPPPCILFHRCILQFACISLRQVALQRFNPILCTAQSHICTLRVLCMSRGHLRVRACNATLQRLSILPRRVAVHLRSRESGIQTELSPSCRCSCPHAWLCSDCVCVCPRQPVFTRRQALRCSLIPGASSTAGMGKRVGEQRTSREPSTKQLRRAGTQMVLAEADPPARQPPLPVAPAAPKAPKTTRGRLLGRLLGRLPELTSLPTPRTARLLAAQSRRLPSPSSLQPRHRLELTRLPSLTSLMCVRRRCPQVASSPSLPTLPEIRLLPRLRLLRRASLMGLRLRLLGLRRVSQRRPQRLRLATSRCRASAWRRPRG